MNEREKVVEKRCRSLPSESSTKLHTAEEVLGCLTESGTQKNLLLQVGCRFFPFICQSLLNAVVYSKLLQGLFI